MNLSLNFMIKMIAILANTKSPNLEAQSWSNIDWIKSYQINLNKNLTRIWLFSSFIFGIQYNKAMTVISKQETHREGWLLRIMDGRSNPLMDPKIIGNSDYLFIYLSIFSIYLYIHLTYFFLFLHIYLSRYLFIIFSLFILYNDIQIF